ncbi:MAG: AraC family transcriptional regulator [Clostridia bacterium]|nr:AraC family transcriptional regulator [Clostridia bacterium]
MSGKSVNETAVLSGFVNTSHFIRTFKNETGKTPLQYCRSKI